MTKRRVKNNGELPQFYCKDTHPAIIDKGLWMCVQLEFKRQEQFTEDHFMVRFHQNSEKYPFVGKIICKHCGHAFVLRKSNRKDNYGVKYWRCKGRVGTVIEGQLYTEPSPYVKPSSGSKSDIKREKCRKPKVVRKILCTDISIDDSVPEKAFIKAWNQLVNENFQKTNGKDVLEAYRAKELIRLIKEYGYIDTMQYELMLKTLDHIEIWANGSVEVIFLAGIRIIIKDKFFNTN